MGDFCGVRDQLLLVHKELFSLEWDVSAINVSRVLEVLNHATIAAQHEMTSVELSDGVLIELQTLLPSAMAMIADALMVKRVLIFSPEQAERYEQAEEAMGADITKRFPSASYEIDEAAKCYAFYRSTAVVFHLMRVMEIGLKASYKCLGIPNPIAGNQRNWGNMLRSMRSEIDRRNKTIPVRWNNTFDSNLFGEIHVSLDAVKIVWRSATMHVENKYSAEEADHIFGAVRGFMKKLASRMDEHGQPLA